jgi:hypothetical protein
VILSNISNKDFNKIHASASLLVGKAFFLIFPQKEMIDLKENILFEKAF